MPPVPAEAAVRLEATISALYEEYFGRAPRRVEAHLHPDSLLVIAHGVLSAEELGYTDRVDKLRLRECRTLFQFAEPERFCGPVEAILGRRVVGLVSGIDVDADVATETFLLAPAPTGARRRFERGA